MNRILVCHSASAEKERIVIAVVNSVDEEDNEVTIIPATF